MSIFRIYLRKVETRCQSFFLHLITFSTNLLWLDLSFSVCRLFPLCCLFTVLLFLFDRSVVYSSQPLFEFIKPYFPPFLAVLYDIGVDNVWNTPMIVKKKEIQCNTWFCTLYAPWKETRFRFHFHYQKKVNIFYFLSRAEKSVAQQRHIFVLLFI